MYISNSAKQWKKERGTWWSLFIFSVLAIVLIPFTGGMSASWFVYSLYGLAALSGAIVFTYEVLLRAEVREGISNLNKVLRDIDNDPNLSEEQKAERKRKVSEPDGSILGNAAATVTKALGAATKGLFDGFGLTKYIIPGLIGFGALYYFTNRRKDDY